MATKNSNVSMVEKNKETIKKVSSKVHEELLNTSHLFIDETVATLTRMQKITGKVIKKSEPIIEKQIEMTFDAVETLKEQAGKGGKRALKLLGLTKSYNKLSATISEKVNEIPSTEEMIENAKGIVTAAKNDVEETINKATETIKSVTVLGNADAKKIENKVVAKTKAVKKIAAKKATAVKATATKVIAKATKATKAPAIKKTNTTSKAKSVTATKKVTAKKVATPKVATKKVTAKKVTAKKVVAPKVATKKVTAKKVATPKVATKKVTAKKVVAPKVATPKVTAKKVVAPKVATPKVAAKKVVAPKTATKKAPATKLELTKIKGIGSSLATIMSDNGIKTIKDLQNATPAALKIVATKAGNRYKSFDTKNWITAANATK